MTLKRRPSTRKYSLTSELPRTRRRVFYGRVRALTNVNSRRRVLLVYGRVRALTNVNSRRCVLYGHVRSLTNVISQRLYNNTFPYDWSALSHGFEIAIFLWQNIAVCDLTAVMDSLRCFYDLTDPLCSSPGDYYQDPRKIVSSSIIKNYVFDNKLRKRNTKKRCYRYTCLKSLKLRQLIKKNLLWKLITCSLLHFFL